MHLDLAWPVQTAVVQGITAAVCNLGRPWRELWAHTHPFYKSQ